MGEKSTSPVYGAKYEDGKVIFEPIGEFEAAVHDVADVYTDNCDYVISKPLPYISAIMEQPITLRAFLRRNGLRGFYKAIGMPAYLMTEYLFPKKKKRGTARRKRRIKRAEQSFINFVHAKRASGLIGIRATNVIIDEYIISNDELPAFAGPFEGEDI